MHDTAAAFGAAFFRCYADGFQGARILEVGARDENGTLRGCAPHDSRYTGIDLEAGPGVDVVLSDPHTYPFEAAIYDFIVSSSCFEHDPMFWLSFGEMCRVLRTGGFIYLNAPSNGQFHRFPTDNWRFYPDAGLALAGWGRRNGHDIRLVESFIGRRRRDIWNDCVMIFGKGDTPRQQSLLADIFPRSLNIRVGEQDTLSNYCEPTEDMTLRSWLIEKLRSSSTPEGNDYETTPIETLLVSLAEREVALGAAEREAAERSAAAEAIIGTLQNDLAAVRSSVAQTEAEAADLRNALGERDAALQRAEAETADLRSVLAERDAASAAAAAELQRVEAGLSARDAALARAEQAASKQAAKLIRAEAALGERDAAIAMLQNELATTVLLRDELTAARQVSRSLLAALRTGPVLVPALDRLVRQPQGIFRLIRDWTGHAWR